MDYYDHLTRKHFKNVAPEVIEVYLKIRENQEYLRVNNFVDKRPGSIIKNQWVNRADFQFPLGSDQALYVRAEDINNLNNMIQMEVDRIIQKNKEAAFGDRNYDRVKTSRFLVNKIKNLAQEAAQKKSWKHKITESEVAYGKSLLYPDQKVQFELAYKLENLASLIRPSDKKGNGDD